MKKGDLIQGKLKHGITQQGSLTYEVLPRKIEDDTFLLASIKTELNGLIHIKTEYSFKYHLFRDETGIYLKQYISSKTEAGISFLLNFYEKLYAGNIAFTRTDDTRPVTKPEHFYTVGLDSHHSLQIKKPGEIGLNTFSSSAGLIENVINETALNLGEGEFIEFNFTIVPSSYDKLIKEALYTIKEINTTDEYKEELRGSFNDKLGFFLFTLNACHNMSNENIFGDILYKNVRLYDSERNYYEYKYSNSKYPTIPERYRKGQVDLFLAHGLVSLISESSRYIQKLPSVILPINPALSLNNGTGKKIGEHRTYIGKGFRDLRLNIQEYVSFDGTKMKNTHSIILGGTGAGKSYTASSMIAYDIVKSVISDLLNFEKYGSPRGQYIIIDPHYSLYSNIYKILEIFNRNTNSKYQSDFGVIEYLRGNEEDETNTDFATNKVSFTYEKVKLVFNPLYSKTLDISSPSKLLESINKLTSACLEGIRATHSKTSFGPQNTDIISTSIRLFTLFNIFRNEKNKKMTTSENEYTRMFNLGDIHTFLEEMEIYKSLPDGVFGDFKEILNSGILELETVAIKLKQKIDYYLEQLKKNAGYLSSSINKMTPYSMELKETFGSGTTHLNYAFDITDIYIKKDYEKTRVHFFNLGGFSVNEKNIISGWLLAYSYHYGSTKNHTNKQELMNTSIFIDEASAVLNGEYILEIIASSLAEMRKYAITLNFFLQSIDQKAFSLIYPNIGYLFVFSVDYKQADLILNDLNSGSPGKLLVHNDIINNQRGRFYAFFKFISGGNSTFLVEGFAMNEAEITFLIS